MTRKFEGWTAVGERLQRQAIEEGKWLNEGQRASLYAIAARLPNNGIILADEVGMGKTRIAVSAVRAVTECGGRVALLIPPGLGFQWQDELNRGGVESTRVILRSLRGYLEAWRDAGAPDPWFDQSIVTLSHAFANWRLSESSQTWRWEMLPLLYAQWRKCETGRFPRGYHPPREYPWDAWATTAAMSICNNLRSGKSTGARQAMCEIAENTPWPSALDAAEYSRNASLRPFLEKAVGLGLGVFDLVVIDEAHKSRGQESGLNRLLENIVLHSADARRLAITATPVELDDSQWKSTLQRIGVKDTETVNESIKSYSQAVRRVRQCWRSNEEARRDYVVAARTFQEALSPYLLRRDKRQDGDVKKFMDVTGETHDSYRRESEIRIETNQLSPVWRQALCATEALSLVSERDDWVTKRLRLTIGNGHGVATILDQVKREESEYDTQEVADTTNASADPVNVTISALSTDVAYERNNKRQQRAEWWRSLMACALSGVGDRLYEHPAILRAVEEIESCTKVGEKVLVFGRFTRPMRALVELLNARAMIRALEGETPWPQSKVHEMERDAVVAAHTQLSCNIPVGEIDKRLEEQYRRIENRRTRLRDQLFDLIEKGLSRNQADAKALSNAARNASSDTRALLTRALDDLMESPEQFECVQCAKAFVDLITALRNQDEGDADGDGKLDEEEAEITWETLERRLTDEYGSQRGVFARLMNGETAHPTRRILQLAFNRENSFPKVLVAQSTVGREGLNLHRACRFVVLLHPEWNPGVVEQQIGRVDRVESRWAQLLRTAIDNGTEIPRIEIRPVIFAGTYDEHNWKVLRERWDDLRAQLHGVVVPARERSDTEGRAAALIEWIDQSGPDFHPSRDY